MADLDLKEVPRTKAKTKTEAKLTKSKTPVGLEKQLRKLLIYYSKLVEEQEDQSSKVKFLFKLITQIKLLFNRFKKETEKNL